MAATQPATEKATSRVTRHFVLLHVYVRRYAPKVKISRTEPGSPCGRPNRHMQTIVMLEVGCDRHVLVFPLPKPQHVVIMWRSFRADPTKSNLVWLVPAHLRVSKYVWTRGDGPRRCRVHMRLLMSFIANRWFTIVFDRTLRSRLILQTTKRDKVSAF